MEFVINECELGFYLSIDNKERTDYFYASDTEIAQYLDIPLEKYNIILMNRNGFQSNVFFLSLYFKNKEDAEKAIKDLEPYLVIQKLIG